MLDNKTIIIIIITFMFLWIFYATPFWFVNFMVPSLAGDFRRAYIRPNGEIISFWFNHADNDSDRVNELIKNSKNNQNDLGITSEYNNTEYPRYLYINSSRVGNYTITQSAIARICKKLLNNKLNREHIDVGILVNTRNFNDNKMEKGNFLRLGVVRIYKDDSLEEICRKFINHVEEIRCGAKKYGRYSFSISEGLEFIKKVDYIFNGLRAHKIMRDNGEVIKGLPIKGYPSKDDIEYLFKNSRKAIVTIEVDENERFIILTKLDDEVYFDNNY